MILTAKLLYTQRQNYLDERPKKDGVDALFHNYYEKDNGTTSVNELLKNGNLAPLLVYYPDELHEFRHECKKIKKEERKSSEWLDDRSSALSDQRRTGMSHHPFGDYTSVIGWADHHLKNVGYQYDPTKPENELFKYSDFYHRNLPQKYIDQNEKVVLSKNYLIDLMKYAECSRRSQRGCREEGYGDYCHIGHRGECTHDNKFNSDGHWVESGSLNIDEETGRKKGFYD